MQTILLHVVKELLFRLSVSIPRESLNLISEYYSL